MKPTFEITAKYRAWHSNVICFLAFRRKAMPYERRSYKMLDEFMDLLDFVLFPPTDPKDPRIPKL